MGEGDENNLINALKLLSENINNYFIKTLSMGYTESLIDIKILQDLSDEELKKFTIKSIDLITLSDNDDYYKYNHLEKLTSMMYQLDIELAKLYVKKALQYSDIAQMYGIARGCYEVSHDKPFSTEIYKKAIKRSLQAKNSSRLHLLGQSMSFIDIDGDDYFQKWGEEIKTQAKQMSDKQKAQG